MTTRSTPCAPYFSNCLIVNDLVTLFNVNFVQMRIFCYKSIIMFDYNYITITVVLESGADNFTSFRCRNTTTDCGTHI